MTYPDRVPPPPRSALTLRLVLAIFGLLVSIGAAVIFAIFDVPPLFIAIAILAAAIAAIDIAVIQRKVHHNPR
jgi:hypothetical protein